MKINYTSNCHVSGSIIRAKNPPGMLYRSHDIMGQSHNIMEFISFCDIQCFHNFMGFGANFAFLKICLLEPSNSSHEIEEIGFFLVSQLRGTGPQPPGEGALGRGEQPRVRWGNPLGSIPRHKSKNRHKKINFKKTNLSKPLQSMYFIHLIVPNVKPE